MMRFAKIKPVKQPWIHSAALDLAVIVAPPFASIFCVFWFAEFFDQTTSLPLWAWVAFILCIDVAHVYSTLYRTYFIKSEFEKNRNLLKVIPMAAWLVGVALYSISSLMFWRVLAYVAVYHFIRQQYGFMMLYSRYELNRSFRYIDKALIYMATLYPLLYWHTHLPRHFSWFIDGDFAEFIPPELDLFGLGIYIATIVAYLAKETFLYIQSGSFSFPKQMVILGTALSWYVGIVKYNGDMTFTLTNVVSHGIPYMALIWIYGRKQVRLKPETQFQFGLNGSLFFSPAFLPVFLGGLILLASLEESLWSELVWNLDIVDSMTLTWLVPLLALPQITHYVLDGFIWKLRDPTAEWQEVAFAKETEGL